MIPRTATLRPGAAPETVGVLARLRRATLTWAVVVAAGLAPLAWAAEALGAAGLALQALVVFAAGTALAMRGLVWHLPVERLGAANRVTLARFGLVSLLAAFVLHPGAAQHPVMAWALAATAAVAAAMDALDGALARAHGTASAFGARFDMEVDALLVLVLAALVMQAGNAGAWVLAAGALRYVFVAAGALLPWLNRTLPHSVRRKAVCAVQVSVLVACMVPSLPAPWPAMLAATGLAALVWSFAVDVAWLFRARRNPMEPIA